MLGCRSAGGDDRAAPCPGLRAWVGVVARPSTQPPSGMLLRPILRTVWSAPAPSLLQWGQLRLYTQRLCPDACGGSGPVPCISPLSTTGAHRCWHPGELSVLKAANPGWMPVHGMSQHWPNTGCGVVLALVPVLGNCAVPWYPVWLRAQPFGVVCQPQGTQGWWSTTMGPPSGWKILQRQRWNS